MTNDTQLSLPFDPGGKLESAFWKFHAEHPEVYRYLVRFAREWVMTGHRKIGIAALFERVRWEIGILSDEVPKLNNNHRAFYARLLMEREATLAGLFSIRRQRRQATFGPENDDLPESRHIA